MRAYRRDHPDSPGSDLDPALANGMTGSRARLPIGLRRGWAGGRDEVPLRRLRAARTPARRAREDHLRPGRSGPAEIPMDLRPPTSPREGATPVAPGLKDLRRPHVSVPAGHPTNATRLSRE